MNEIGPFVPIKEYFYGKERHVANVEEPVEIKYSSPEVTFDSFDSN